VRSVFPLGARAGETIEVTFLGRRLNDLAEITFARKDIHCSVISSDDFIVRAKVSVGPDVPTGCTITGSGPGAEPTSGCFTKLLCGPS
jgi:hypothetical protein